VLLIKYKTVKDEGFSEIVIQKSRFIGRIIRASGRDEAEAFFSSVRAEHRDARHNVPAFIIGDKMQLRWASDDGEPQGTAGAPIVELLSSEGITNTAVMVTRYFGGIKLGTGGLVRAYTSAAKEALLSAGIVSVIGGQRIIYELSYPLFDKVRHYADKSGVKLSEIVYTNNVGFHVLTASQKAEQIIRNIEGVTLGTAHPVRIIDEDIYCER
jgi:uncharacterized YigZ family protein